MYGRIRIGNQVAFIVLAVVSVSAHAKSCDDLKSEIAAKIDGNHVVGYTLDVVANDQVGDRKVVGSCGGGSHKIVYSRGGGAPASDAKAGAEDSSKKQ